MINQVSTNSLKAQNPFSDFDNAQKDKYLMMPKINTQPDTFKKEKEEKKSTHKLGKTIALTTLGTGFGILFLMRGLPKNAYKTIEKWSEKLETKVFNARKNGKMSKLDEFFTFTLGKLSGFMNKAKSINNFVSIKDITFEKIMSKNKYTKKIHTKITEVYEKIGKRTVKKAYEKTKTKLNGLFQRFEDVDDTLMAKRKSEKVKIGETTKTVEEWLNDIEVMKTDIRKTWNSGFGLTKRDERLAEITKATDGLSKRVWEATAGNMSNLKKKDMYETFIAEEMLAGDKLKLINEVKKIRYAITRDIEDNYDSALDVINNITSFVHSNDRTSRGFIKDLRNHLAQYKKLSGPNESEVRNGVNKEITIALEKLAQNIRESQSLYKYDLNTVNQVTKYVEDISTITDKSSKGKMQEILTIYKNLLGRESDEYKKLKEAVMTTSRQIDKSVTMETDQFFDMKRDLVTGSAPTDILSILAGVGAIGIGLQTAENKDQKNSVLLKAGIPALGAIATSLYFSASLVSGGRSMLYGALSGLLISKAGSMLDDFRKKHFPVKEAPKKLQTQ